MKLYILILVIVVFGNLIWDIKVNPEKYVKLKKRFFKDRKNNDKNILFYKNGEICITIKLKTEENDEK